MGVIGLAEVQHSHSHLRVKTTIYTTLQATHITIATHTTRHSLPLKNPSVPCTLKLLPHRKCWAVRARCRAHRVALHARTSSAGTVTGTCMMCGSAGSTALLPWCPRPFGVVAPAGRCDLAVAQPQCSCSAWCCVYAVAGAQSPGLCPLGNGRYTSVNSIQVTPLGCVGSEQAN